MSGFKMAGDSVFSVGEVSGTVNIVETLDVHTAHMEKKYGFSVFMFLKRGKSQGLSLTEAAQGHYAFKPSYIIGGKNIWLDQAGKEDSWHVFIPRPYRFLDKNEKQFEKCKLEDQQILRFGKSFEEGYLYVEYNSPQNNTYYNYVPLKEKINIGSSSSCDIVISHRNVVGIHAQLTIKNNNWDIIAAKSETGVYVDDIRIASKSLSPGSHIRILGLHIIVGVGYIAINSENPYVRLKSTSFESNLKGKAAFSITKESDEAIDYFIRAPRKRKNVGKSSITIEPPPMSLNSDSMPLVLRMGSSLVMSSTALLAGHVTMMLSSVLFPVLTQKYTEKQRIAYEEKRHKKYSMYLMNKQREIRQEITREEKIYNENYQPFQEVLQYPLTRKRLWERRTFDDDFLLLRLGSGNRSMIAELDYPQRAFVLDEDHLETRMYTLAEQNYQIENVPMMISLKEDHVIGIRGSRKQLVSYMQQLIMEISILHSSDEVKCILLANENELQVFEFARYLPHFWDNMHNMRFIASTPAEVMSISACLQPEFEMTINGSKHNSDERPYYVVFALDEILLSTFGIIKTMMSMKEEACISVVAAGNNLPKECSKVIELSLTGMHKIVHMRELGVEDDCFITDRFSSELAAQSMKAIANLHLMVKERRAAMPKMLTFLEMYNAGRLEHLNPLLRWKENDPVKSLSVPIGVGEDGELFCLDLHQKAQGPHGLVAGMTGSGKSEFIITYILSLALNFHPYEVAFVLIDYKGGGLADAFDDPEKNIYLPHLVGTITNLDGSMIQRSLTAIESELKRRQRIFREARQKTDEGTIDIYTYQKLFRQGIVEEPLPHLFIISDEFAELKSQEPEFMDQLISAARIGRSLGIHLILATQKPAGVVNEQILSNTKFRVCLKVQDKYDSIDMLQRPDAAELKETGRFFLQVGYDEYFALGQSAWCGADYVPSDEVEVIQDDSIRFIENTGKTVLEVKRPKEKGTAEGSQLVQLVRYLTELSVKEDIHMQKLWLDPLPALIDIDALKEEYPHRYGHSEHAIMMGMIDDPENQRQFPMFMELIDGQNMLIVGEGSCGKTTFLKTMAYQIVSDFTPQQMQMYMIDLSSRTFKAFTKTSHCGAAMYEEDNEQIIKFFEWIDEEINHRKRKFGEAEISDFEAYCQVESIPFIVVMVDNIAGFAGVANGDHITDLLIRSMKEGIRYGIKFIVTANNLGDCKYGMRQELSGRIALKAKDAYGYGDILEARCRFVPAADTGRGICLIDQKCYEFHTAIFAADLDEQSRSIELRKRLEELNEKYDSYDHCFRIKNNDQAEDYVSFCENMQLERIPLGYQISDGKIAVIPFQQLFSISLYAGQKMSAVMLWKNMSYAAYMNRMHMWIVKKTSGSIIEEEIAGEWSSNVDHLWTLSCTEYEIEELHQELCDKLLERIALRKSICKAAEIEDWESDSAVSFWKKELRKQTEPIFVGFESFYDLCMSVGLAAAIDLQAYFKMASGYNIYFAAMFYPEDEARLHELAFDSNDENEERRKIVKQLTGTYNPDRFVLMSGGCFNKVDLIELPYEYRDIDKPCSIENLDKVLMHYRDNLYSLRMPFGKGVETNEDPDEKNIL